MSPVHFIAPSARPPARPRCRWCRCSRWCCGWIDSPRWQTLQGSFSAVSKRNFASKYALESSRRDLHNAFLCTALKSHFLKKIEKWKISRNFENWLRCKGMHCVDLGESFPTSIYLQNVASIQPRTSLVKFARSPCTHYYYYYGLLLVLKYYYYVFRVRIIIIIIITDYY